MVWMINIECIILHELIHLFHWRADKSYAPGNDHGTADFEIAAYEQIVFQDYAGWAS